MNLHKKAAAFICICTLAASCTEATVFASPSISDLSGRQELTVASENTDGTNTASLLSRVDIYTNQAVSDQYKTKDENGNLIPTNLSNLVDLSASVIEETGENGKSIVDSIPSVTDILTSISKQSPEEYEKEYGYNPDSLDQLTYMLDFKYTSTNYRIIPGNAVTGSDETEILDNGSVSISVKRNEILRSSSPENFVIIQVDPVTEQVYFVRLREYNEKTGSFTADFPCVGPYMITQIMNP